MNFIHYEFDLSDNEFVEVTLDHPANVMLLDDENFALYKKRRKYHYSGGHAKTSPVTVDPPHPGHWNLVIDLGGFGGKVRAWATVLQDA